MKASEANIISFKVIFDSKGKLITETSSLPFDDAKKVFKGYELKVVETILRETKQKLLKIHDNLEAELNALNTKIT
jgi:hypothetical protein|tara:strand:+ start:257 stop:484 length:228 start_codon:yes stop_codon:yes gene_type:complete